MRIEQKASSEGRKLVERRRLKGQLAMTDVERRAKDLMDVLVLLDLVKEEAEEFKGDLTHTRERLKDELAFFLVARHGWTRTEADWSIDDRLESQD